MNLRALPVTECVDQVKFQFVHDQVYSSFQMKGLQAFPSALLAGKKRLCAQEIISFLGSLFAAQQNT